MRRIICLVLMAAMAVSSLCGCASKYGEQRTSVQYYPGCYRPIQELRNNEHNVAKGTAGGAIVGALGGALIGLLAGGGKWQGAVAGAAVGGAGGAIAGSMYTQKQQQADDNMRLASYLQDLDGDISNLDIAGASARSSLQCYDKAFDALLAQIRAKTITREAAAQRYGEISTGREEAIAILGHAVDNGRNLNQQYEQAFASEEQQMKTPQKMAQGQAAYQQKAQRINSARQRSRVLSQKTTELAKEREQAQLVSSRQTQELNAAMANLEELRS